MEIQVKIDPACREPKVLVCTHAMTDEVQAILQALAQAPPQLLPGFREGTLELLEPQDLLRVYAAGGKVFAVTPAGEFQLRLRLYEAEARLDKTVFVGAAGRRERVLRLPAVRGQDQTTLRGVR